MRYCYCLNNMTNDLTGEWKCTDYIWVRFSQTVFIWAAGCGLLSCNLCSQKDHSLTEINTWYLGWVAVMKQWRDRAGSLGVLHRKCIDATRSPWCHGAIATLLFASGGTMFKTHCKLSRRLVCALRSSSQKQEEIRRHKLGAEEEREIIKMMDHADNPVFLHFLSLISSNQVTQLHCNVWKGCSTDLTQRALCLHCGQKK